MKWLDIYPCTGWHWEHPAPERGIGAISPSDTNSKYAHARLLDSLWKVHQITLILDCAISQVLVDVHKGKAQWPRQTEGAVYYPQVSPRLSQLSPRLKATLRERRAGGTLRGRVMSSRRHQALLRSTENFKTERGMDPTIRAGKGGTRPRKLTRSSQVMDQ